ncbi:glutathione S-transferase [Sorangium cellulosum]|uniref:Glutathione S-transferase n=1 Tax=Sorangium cellulosum TaxID=56 RepID=A0A4P2Q1R6_SORCE|nr:glutathione transferase GstA [Sorangium cellulosum]AUX23217.1 glutathione S-transferase [Sorangium cellulosum]
MRLYFSPGACSLSPHIALREAGLEFHLERVHLGTKKTRSGADFTRINPKGYVPALELEDGQVLTEGPAIVQYIADLRPGSGLAPPAGSLDRYRLQEWLSFIGTELHKQFSPLFTPRAPDEQKTAARAYLGRRLAFAAQRLDGAPYLMGDRFTVADGYLFTVLTWTRFARIDLGAFPALVAYAERVGARPAVQAAMKAEREMR